MKKFVRLLRIVLTLASALLLLRCVESDVTAWLRARSPVMAYLLEKAHWPYRPLVDIDPSSKFLPPLRAWTSPAVRVGYETAYGDGGTVSVFLPQAPVSGPADDDPAFAAWVRTQHAQDVRWSFAGIQYIKWATIVWYWDKKNLFQGYERSLILSRGWTFACLAALPGRAMVLAARRRRRRKLEKAGLCVGCGYDLRASPGRCPECGREAVRL